MSETVSRSDRRIRNCWGMWCGSQLATSPRPIFFSLSLLYLRSTDPDFSVSLFLFLTLPPPKLSLYKSDSSPYHSQSPRLRLRPYLVTSRRSPVKYSRIVKSPISEWSTDGTGVSGRVFRSSRFAIPESANAHSGVVEQAFRDNQMI